MIWIVTILFIAPFAAGQFKDIVFAGGSCMQKCALELGDLSEIADPKNIEKLVKNLDKLCDKFQTAQTCASLCPEEEKKQFETSATLVSHICVEKLHILTDLSPCIVEHNGEAITACDAQCGSLDNMLNPGTFVDFMTQIEGMGPICTTLKCTIKCLKQDMNTRCPGAGDFIRDIAVKQVEVEQMQLNSDISNRNNTHASHLVKLLRHMPSVCAYVMESDHFRETVDSTNEIQTPPPETPAEHPAEHPDGKEKIPETNEVQPGQALTKTSVNLIASVFTLFLAAMIALV